METLIYADFNLKKLFVSPILTDMRKHRFTPMKCQSGQAIIVVLLIIVVALTIGLSITARSIKDIKLSTRTEESQRAFSAAEAGLESSLLTGNSVPFTNLGSSGTSYSVNVTNVGGDLSFKFPSPIKKDETQQIWLVNHDSSGNLQNCQVASCYAPKHTGGSYQSWEKDFSIGVCMGGDAIDTTKDPAIEISLIYKDGGNYKIQKYAYDINKVANGNNFSLPSSSAGDLTRCPSGGSWKYAIAQQLPSNPNPFNANNDYTALRIRFLYNGNYDLGVYSTKADQNIPTQGKQYSSQGSAQVSGTSETEIRKITFFKSWPALPGIFDFAIFSGSDINKP